MALHIGCLSVDDAPDDWGDEARTCTVKARAAIYSGDSGDGTLAGAPWVLYVVP